MDKLELIKQYLEPTGVSINELTDRNILNSLYELLDAYAVLLTDHQNKQSPNYAVKGDYCAVCGCTEFWNDEEE